MSLQPEGLPEIPEQTARVARAAFQAGTLAMRVRDRLGEVFADEPFTAAFGVRGAPGLSPAVLSLVSVLQYAQNLTDRQAAQMAVRAIEEEVRARCGVDRYRVRCQYAGEVPGPAGPSWYGTDHLRPAARALQDRGVLAAGGKQRTDCTHVISAVRDLNRLELARQSVRAALEALAVAAPDWLATTIDLDESAHRYGPRIDSWAMPGSKTKRDHLALVYGQDALTLYRAVCSAEAPAWLRELPAMELLRRMFMQAYYVCTDSRGREVIVRRDPSEHGVPPSRTRLASPR